ncbi:emopamil binding protein [Lasiosphaeris hirsuta]|uniref:Emopamil binding protein n=1 Tax=Lasiosphaeris hirsuta TaxID=260670 RepID=A0AA40DS29_9PEZI|nr:emopamil binding protein [Lasiosphaeris hirsuta]
MHGHPYYPPGVKIPGRYSPNVLAVPVLLGAFGIILIAIVAVVQLLAKQVNPAIGRPEQLTLAWFTLCAFLHCFFEAGYFILNHESIAASQHLFAQLWKEYALSDSRYMTSDPFMLCIEALTVFIWGPLSILTAILIIRDKASNTTGLRHILQSIVSVGHLYGVALYYGTCYFEERYNGVSYNRPEFLYYWAYYVGLNSPWAVVPAVLLYRSSRAVSRAFQPSQSNATDFKKQR